MCYVCCESVAFSSFLLRFIVIFRPHLCLFTISFSFSLPFIPHPAHAISFFVDNLFILLLWFTYLFIYLFWITLPKRICLAALLFSRCCEYVTSPPWIIISECETHTHTHRTHSALYLFFISIITLPECGYIPYRSQ